jgi:hypothetical protein
MPELVKLTVEAPKVACLQSKGATEFDAASDRCKTLGNYMVTVTGSSGALTASTTVAVTVN